MSSERLSKLQKWIIVKALPEGFIPNNKWIIKNFWGEEKVWERIEKRYGMDGNFYGFYNFNYLKNKYRASVSRSKKNLREKEIIQRRYGHEKAMELTEQGKALALKLTVRVVNNKKMSEKGRRVNNEKMRAL